MTQKFTQRTRLVIYSGIAAATFATTFAFSPLAHTHNDHKHLATTSARPAQVVSAPAHPAPAQPQVQAVPALVQTQDKHPQTVESVAPVSFGSSYVSTARQSAVEAGISPDRFVRQIDQESGFNPSAVSSVGAIGIAQFMPTTAAALGINPHDPVASLHGAARHMASLSSMYGGDYAKALAAYNAGPGAVNGAVSRGGANWLAYTPGETQQYVNKIM